MSASKTLAVLFLCVPLLASSAVSSSAQTLPDTNDIIRSLAPRANQVVPESSGASRSTAPSLPQAEAATETVVIRKQTYVVDLVRTLDLEVFFDYGSANISPNARLVLDRLGAAIVSRSLKGSKFLIAGHTDAAGSDEYNLDLSDRRAEAVARYLLDRFPIEPSQLVSVGFGFRRLKAPESPRAAINRRVQIAIIVS